MEGLGEACPDLEDGAEEEVEDERPFAAVAVGEEAEDDLGQQDTSAFGSF